MNTPQERGAQFAAAICAAPNYERQSAADRLRDLERKLSRVMSDLTHLADDLSDAFVLASELKSNALTNAIATNQRRINDERARLDMAQQYARSAISYLQQNGSLWS